MRGAADQPGITPGTRGLELACGSNTSPRPPFRWFPVLPEAMGSVMIRPEKAAGMGARRRAGARRTSRPPRNALRADQGLPIAPG